MSNECPTPPPTPLPPQPGMEEQAPPARPKSTLQAIEDELEPFHKATEKVGFNSRLTDHALQFGLAVAGTILLGGYGLLTGGCGGAIGFGLLGFIVFAFIGGFIIMIRRR
ncbi:hypothetical protein KQI84_00625 [bacterium]|nr:hypothetical protein [bacterium]